MAKYTNLEQAIHDPSLAIITDSITTQKELNRVYARYEVLPKRQKRYSNKEIEAVIGELNSIDKCFVNNDEDAIKEILRRAEANTEISEWHKLKIMNECQAALLELKV